MNERIRELADEATSYADTLDVADQRIYQKIRDREFAELIVRECANIVDKYGESPELLHIVAHIKQHFGVES
jgi:hypothetical protein